MKAKFFGTALGLGVLVLGLPATASAQSLVGVKGGLLVSDVSASDEQSIEGIESRTGAGFGAFFRTMIAPAVSVQPEVLYVTKGFESADEEITGEFTLNYIQVPILVQYHLTRGDGVSPRLFAGPAIAFESKCEISGSDGSTEVEFDCSEADIETKSTDFSAVFGAGVDIPLSGFVITGDARYDLGLSNIDDSGADGSVKNRSWGFFLGGAIPVGS